MSQQPSYPTPWSRLPGCESLQPLTWEEGGAQDAEQKTGPAWSVFQGHSQLLELSLSPVNHLHFTHTL